MNDETSLVNSNLTGSNRPSTSACQELQDMYHIFTANKLFVSSDLCTPESRSKTDYHVGSII